MLVKAGISINEDARKDLVDAKIDIMLEAQRCLSNIYLQCHKAQDLALNNQTLPGIMHQVTKYKDHQVPPQIISFDMKLLFLITAHRPEARFVSILSSILRAKKTCQSLFTILFYAIEQINFTRKILVIV